MCDVSEKLNISKKSKLLVYSSCFLLYIIGFKLFLSMKVKLFQETQQRCSIFKVPGIGMNLAFQEAKKSKAGRLIP